MNLEPTDLPSGVVLVKDLDDARSMAAADRLGLRAGIEAMLRSTDGPCGAAGIQKDGEWLVAVMAWARCDRGNGWASLMMTPADEQTTAFMCKLVRRLVAGPPD